MGTHLFEHRTEPPRSRAAWLVSATVHALLFTTLAYVSWTTLHRGSPHRVEFGVRHRRGVERRRRRNGHRSAMRRRRSLTPGRSRSLPIWRSARGLRSTHAPWPCRQSATPRRRSPQLRNCRCSRWAGRADTATRRPGVPDRPPRPPPDRSGWAASPNAPRSRCSAPWARAAASSICSITRPA